MSGKALAMSNTELAFAGLETTLAFTSVGDSLLSIANKNHTMLASNSPAIAGYAAGQLAGDAIIAYAAPKGLNLSGKTLKNIGGRTFGMFGRTVETGEKIEKIIISEKRVGHIFRDKAGHLPNTPENHQLLKSIAEDPSTTLGKDKFGNTWSAKINPDGSQVWVQTRDGEIINGGLNLKPKTYHPETGLSSLVKPNNK